MPCPYCLQPKPRTSSVFTQEKKDIDAEIEHVGDLISRLIIEQSKLREKKNEMKSPIYSLPTEILALIFKFACPPFDFLRRYGLYGGNTLKAKYPSPRIIGMLSAVSARWHKVVLSTPSLWTSFVADDSDVRFMRTVLDRSGNLPISASITTLDGIPLLQTTVLEPILQEAARIRMLHVRYASSTWLKEHIASFLDLELLCLQGNKNRDELVVDSSCTHLVLKSFRCRISLSWSKIQVLHLVRVPVGVCLEMLKKCTNLIEFKAQGSDTYSVVEGVQLPSSSFILPRLEVFEWFVQGGSSVDHLLLRYIRMPVLKNLIWGEAFIDLTPPDVLSTFFECLPPTLSAVELHYSGSVLSRSGFSIFPYFLNLPHIKDLVFWECPGSFMDGVFDSLGSVDKNKGKPMLPKLQSISIDRFTRFRQLDQEKVLQTLRCRETLLEKPFRLEFMEPLVDWTPEFQKELNKMVEAGYKVELWEDSEPVDWLSQNRVKPT